MDTKEDDTPIPSSSATSPAWLPYTRSGDTGETSRGDRHRSDKADAWVEAYGNCEEAAAFLGYTVHSGTGLGTEKVRLLTRVQNDLIDVAADLAVPAPVNTSNPVPATNETGIRITADYINRLERACDYFADGLPIPAGFVVPGGTVTAALLHYCHALVRRAERSVVTVWRQHPDTTNPLTVAYLNRLANLLLLLSRSANADLGDTPWQPALTEQLEGIDLWEPLPGEFDQP